MDQQQGIVMLGLMSALRTGHMIFDTAVALLLPNIFTILWQHLQRVFSKGTESVKARTNRSYIRTIEHTRSTRPWAATAAAHKNKILIKAIRAYIGRKVQPTYPSGAVKLQSVQSSSSNESLNKVEQLEKRFHIVTVPPRGERVEVSPGLFFTDSEVLTRDENEEGKKKASTVSTTTVLCFTTDVAGGEERVNSFIKTAYDWYVNEVETSEDHSYFMYQPLVQKYSSADDAPKGTKFKRYRLSGEKTFKSIFFPEKEKVLRILKHFADKTGKYSIKGFPHKLGLLLHGPPGTGKTSLVKAIATHMKRHIISVPLSRIRTNQELMDVMFDQVFKYDEPRKTAEGESTETKNKHLISEVVFLLEDVDAASKVVHARETVAAVGANTPTAGMAREKSMVAKKEVDNDNESTLMRQLSTALTRQATSNREVIAESAAPAANAESTGESPSPLEKQATTVPGEGGDKDKEGEKKDETADPQATKKSMWDEADKLDLAGLLNVLDGVVDAPGRVLIMTTNHPEKLDPALLRPGRVNLQIYMGFISCEDAVHMTSHYYPTASPAQLESVRQAWETKHRKCVNGLKLSPAEYEQICAESDTIPQLLSALDKLVPKR